MTESASTSLTPPSYLDGLALAQDAFDFMVERHSGQLREGDEAPFVLHPLEVGAVLHVLGYSEQIVVAGLLHDVLEDSATTALELRIRFGPRVARIVEALSEDATVADAGARKALLRRQVADAGREAAAVFAADKLSKVREMRIRTACGADAADAATRDKLEHYLASRSMLEQSLTGDPLLAALTFELEALFALPPGR